MTAVIQRAFAAGEISPDLYGRADQVKYQTGLRQARNFIVMRHGGVTRRTGSQHIDVTKDYSQASYMARFVFNQDQTYLIEVGEEYFRFYRGTSQIVVSSVDAWSAITAYVVGDLASLAGVNYYCVLAHTNQTPPNATYWYPLTDDIYEIPTPYALADLDRLRFTQSADVITITHSGYDTMELRRTGHTAWTLVAKNYGSTISAPTGIAVDNVGTAIYYTVTAVDQDSFEESVAGTPAGATAEATEAAPNTITWSAVTGARYYNVYKTFNGVYSFIGIAGSNLSFFDDGITADPAVQPPVTRDVLVGANNRPAVATYYQQRLVVASTLAEPEAVLTSRSGLFDNFTISSPIRADDGIKFSMGDVEVQEVRHLLGSLKLLMVFTGESVRRIVGDGNGVLRPDAINPVQQSAWGSSYVPPVVAGDTAIYVESAGSMVRDLDFDYNSSGYVGKDLTIFSPHLFEGHTILRAAYAKLPHSVWYGVRDDGVLLALTYIREQEIWGWTPLDTDGYYEDVVTIPEGTETAVYVTVRRTNADGDYRAIEKFSSSMVTEIVRNADTAFLDAFLTYDGRNSGATTMTLTGTDWTVIDEDLPNGDASPPDLTLTSSVAFFTAGDVGNVIVMRALNGDGETTDEVRITITAYVSTSVVFGRPDVDVPASLRQVATSDWDRSVDRVTGLDHLEGSTVAILADGNVLARQVVQGGALGLMSQYAVIHVGLPYNSDFETLDLDVEGSQVRGLQKKVDSIQMIVKNSRGIQAGANVDNLNPRGVEQGGAEEDDPLALITGTVSMNISATWSDSGRFLVRQSDPLPLTILAAIPNGEIGG